MIVRVLLRTLLVIVCVAVLLYIADSVMWQVKLSHGKGFDTVEVMRVTVATLKSKKEEYYYDGKDTVQCSNSYLPMISSQGMVTPCWYLKTHRLVRTDY